MTNKVSLSFLVSAKTRKMLKQIALEEDKTMARIIEDFVMLKWQEIQDADTILNSKKTS